MYIKSDYLYISKKINKANDLVFYLLDFVYKIWRERLSKILSTKDTFEFSNKDTVYFYFLAIFRRKRE